VNGEKQYRTQKPKQQNHKTVMKAILNICCLLLLSTIAVAQKDASKIDKWLADNVKDLGGRAVMVVWKDGKIVYNHAENSLTNRQKMVAKFLANRQGGNAEAATQDFTSTTRARIASCSKWLSAALVMTFVDEGKLSLEDTIGKFLPIMTQNGKGGIKIWHCLSHLTGIKGLEGKDSWTEMTNYKSMDEAMASISKQPIEGEAGKTFRYGNTGLQIAAAVIEKIAKKDFETLFQERIAKPCGMLQTDFGKVAVPQAAGGAFSTAEDYINFLVMLLNEGNFNGKQILTAKSVAAMQHNYAKGATIMGSPKEAGNFGYGFGEWTMDDNNRSIAVTSPGLFGSFPWIDNKRHYAAILFSFNLNSNGRHERYVSLKTTVDEVFGQ
jgi:CubicO group peptidase (beta-lactamase class C family)